MSQKIQYSLTWFGIYTIFTFLLHEFLFTDSITLSLFTAGLVNFCLFHFIINPELRIAGFPHTDIKFNSTVEETEEEFSHGDFSGTLTLHDDIVVTYEHAWQEPVIGTINSDDISASLPNDVKFIWTVIKLGNGRVVIEPKSGQITIPRAQGDLKVSVKVGNKTKASIGY